MTVERKIASVFKLNNESWLKHANPWSVWTRYSVLPLIIIAFWSRTWIGWWCVFPATLSIAWMFFNPHFFSKPKSTKNWASKSVMGERIYLNRDKVPIPSIHKKPIIQLLNVISSLGMGLSIWATVTYSIWGAIFGISLAYLGKSWFLDRMVWLFEDMKEANEEYKSWDY